MAIITTYVCDVSGVQGPKEQFVRVSISSQSHLPDNYNTKKTIEKLVHLDVARKLNLLYEYKKEAEVETTFESKLVTLLKQWKDEIVEEAVEAATDNIRNYS